MTRKLFLALLALSVLWLAIGCAGGPERPETISGIDALIEEITWGILDGLPEGPEKTLAVSYFTVQKETSPISDYLINGLSTSLASEGKGRVARILEIAEKVEKNKSWIKDKFRELIIEEEYLKLKRNDTQDLKRKMLRALDENFGKTGIEDIVFDRWQPR
jgi:hypothetical protein